MTPPLFSNALSDLVHCSTNTNTRQDKVRLQDPLEKSPPIEMPLLCAVPCNASISRGRVELGFKIPWRNYPSSHSNALSMCCAMQWQHFTRQDGVDVGVSSFPTSYRQPLHAKPSEKSLKSVSAFCVQ